MIYFLLIVHPGKRHSTTGSSRRHCRYDSKKLSSAVMIPWSNYNSRIVLTQKILIKVPVTINGFIWCLVLSNRSMSAAS